MLSARRRRARREAASRRPGRQASASVDGLVLARPVMMFFVADARAITPWGGAGQLNTRLTTRFSRDVALRGGGARRNWFVGIGWYPSIRWCQVSSYEGRAVDALGQRADEGRGKRRNASGSCNRALIRGSPNGVTRLSDPQALPAECIGRVEGSRRTETSK